MKNMKKTILGVAIIAMFLITMMGSVNAASVTASSSKVNVGDTVTVTFSANDAFKAVEFEMAYNSDKFEFVSAQCDIGTPTATSTNGVVNVAIAGTTTANSVILTFKALAETEAKDFTVSNVIINTNEAVTNATAKVAVEVAQEEPAPVDPVNSDNNNGNVEEDNNGVTADEKQETVNNNKTIVGTDGKTITKLPQTGTPVFVGAIALIVVAGLVLVIRKK